MLQGGIKMESDNNTISFLGKTDIGLQRANNEDAFVVQRLDDSAVLAVVIDGVGGYEGGEVAAEIAQNEIRNYMKEFTSGEKMELLKQAVVCANNAIYERRRFDFARQNMGCVLTAIVVDSACEVVYMAHVGDTRLYQYRYGELCKLSHDHSLVGQLEDSGELTEEQAMKHPRRNVISRVIGSEYHTVDDSDFIEANQFRLLPNSIFMLCSDGLTDLITSHQIASILERDLTLDEKVQTLVNSANEAGGKDNTTVVLVQYNTKVTSKNSL